MSLTQYNPRADGLHQGQVFDTVNGWGAVQSPLYVYKITPAQSVFNNIALVQTVTQGYLTLSPGPGITLTIFNGVGGVLALDVPRNLVISSSSNVDTIVYGWDYRGYPMQEEILAIGGASIALEKAFAKIRAVYVNGTATNIAVGTASAFCAFGLPYRINNSEDVIPIWNNQAAIKQNIGTLTSGAISSELVLNPIVQNDSLIFLSHRTGVTPGNLGVLGIRTIEEKENFTIQSIGNNLDSEKVSWQIKPFNPTDTLSGRATLVGGTVTIPTPSVAANSLIIVSHLTVSATIGELTINTITPGVSFTVNSSSATDATDIAWKILSPGIGASTYPLQGIATLAAGTATVPLPSELNGFFDTVNTPVLLSHMTASGTLGVLYLSSFAATNFVIKSNNAGDTSTVAWQILPSIPNQFGTIASISDNSQSATSGDSRGTVSVATLPDGETTLTVSMYVEGAQGDNQSVEGLYGVSQYYLGDH